ncbi:MAG TPA: hypothetical protein PK156_45505 [Polyangium sp.]|nr:hypothetical protein [Polyangium sp.]
MGSFDDVLKKAVSTATKRPGPDPAIVAAEQAAKEKEAYHTAVQDMANHAIGPAMTMLEKQLCDAGVYCCTSNTWFSDEAAFIYDGHAGKSARIEYRIEPDNGITISATSDDGNQDAYAEIAKFSPSDVREMVAKMGDARSAKPENPDSDHPLTHAIRQAIAHASAT